MTNGPLFICLCKSVYTSQGSGFSTDFMNIIYHFNCKINNIRVFNFVICTTFLLSSSVTPSKKLVHIFVETA
jgi:hypothetical protein